MVSDGNYGESITDGFTLASCTAGYHIVTAQIAINRFYADGYSVAKRQSPLAHEFGHALGLDHSSALSCSNMPVLQPLTSDRYDTCLINTPRSDDIAGVNALY